MEKEKKMKFFVRLKKSIANLEEYEEFAMEKPTKAMRIFYKINDSICYNNFSWNYI